MAIKISVVICTYNRAELLPTALESLVGQSIDPSLYEIIVVNNSSTDDTDKIVKELQYKYSSHDIKLIHEPCLGLSHARNTGWKNGKGEYIAYVDDDCKIPEHWISTANQIIKEKAPAAFGGPYYAFYNSPKPKWYKDSYGSHVQGDKPRELKEHEYLDGGNILFRKVLLQQIGGFDIDLGMYGDKIAYGEETALLRKIRKTMPNQSIYYDPRLYVYHLVAPQKMTMHWIMRHRFIDGRYSYRALQDKHDESTNPLLLIANMSLALLAFGKDVIIDSCFRNRAQYPYWQNYFYEKTFKHISKLGSLYEQLNHLLARRR